MKSLVALALCIGIASVTYSQNWPSFRGQNAAGMSGATGLPITWDAEKSITVLWKTPIPSLGHSSDCLGPSHFCYDCGERVFLPLPA